MRAIILATAASAVVLSGCQTVDTTKSTAVGVDRHQHMLVSSEQINASAEKAYADVLAEAKKQNALDRDAAQVQRVKTIVGRLIPQTAAFREDAPKWKWETHVLSSKEVNAWCMPGGKIAVYTGLIEKLQASDEEIAHALREHGREQASRAMTQQVALGVIGAVANVPSGALDLAPMVLDVTFNLPHSRTDETEADRIGVELAARAGYDPHAAISLWEKMAKLGGNQPPQWLSTHPSNETRR